MKKMNKNELIAFEERVNKVIREWRGLIVLSQKLKPSISKIDNEEIYYRFGYNEVGVS